MYVAFIMWNEKFVVGLKIDRFNLLIYNFYNVQNAHKPSVLFSINNLLCTCLICK